MAGVIDDAEQQIAEPSRRTLLAGIEPMILAA